MTGSAAGLCIEAAPHLYGNEKERQRERQRRKPRELALVGAAARRWTLVRNLPVATGETN